MWYQIIEVSIEVSTMVSSIRSVVKGSTEGHPGIKVSVEMQHCYSLGTEVETQHRSGYTVIGLASVVSPKRVRSEIWSALGTSFECKNGSLANHSSQSNKLKYTRTRYR